MRLRAMHRWLGRATNNEAEYHALIDGLKAVKDWKPDRLEIYMDAKLVVEQLQGRNRIKAPGLKPLYDEAKAILAGFNEVVIEHVDREKNKGADALANMAIDEHVKKPKSAG